MILFLLIVLLGVGTAPAQPSETVTIIPAKAVVAAGQTDTLRLMVQVKEGFHIQGHALKDESLVPTTLTVIAPRGIQAGKAVFPPAQPFLLQGTEAPLAVYDGSFKIAVPLKAAPGLQEGAHTLRAVLRYQACDARTCFFPKSKEFTIPLYVLRKVPR